MEIRRSYDHLISIMGFPILVRRHFYIESGPWLFKKMSEDRAANSVLAKWMVTNILVHYYSDRVWGVHDYIWVGHTFIAKLRCHRHLGLITAAPGPWFNIKMSSYQSRKFHYGDKTVVRSSYLHNGISYTGKTTSLYWIRPQGVRSTWLYMLALGCNVQCT